MGKYLSALSLLAAIWAPAAQASCYSVYDRNDQLIWQNVQSPVDLRQPIGEAVKQRFHQDVHMVFSPSADSCTPVDKVNAGKPDPDLLPMPLR